MRTLGNYQAQTVTLKAPHMSRLSARRHEKLEIAQQATLIRLSSITEAYCGDALIEAAEMLAQPGPTRIVQALWDEAAIKATRTWNEQKFAYKKWLQLTIKWEVIDAMADARNAIAHGLGSLTRQQIKDQATITARLATLSIGLSGQDIVLSDRSLKGLALKARTFILDLDTQIDARRRQP
jgi:hypothetical protein